MFNPFNNWFSDPCDVWNTPSSYKTRSGNYNKNKDHVWVLVFKSHKIKMEPFSRGEDTMCQSNTLCIGFIPKPSYGGFGIFFSTCTYVGIGTVHRVWNMLWKVARKKPIVFKKCLQMSMQNLLLNVTPHCQDYKIIYHSVQSRKAWRFTHKRVKYIAPKNCVCGLWYLIHRQCPVKKSIR